MSARPRFRAPTAVTVLALVAALFAAACSAAPSGTPAPSPTPAGPPPVSPVVGIVTFVDSAGLSDVRGFTLRDEAGRTIAFRIGRLENAAQFPPGHLGEHQLTADPVRVFFREQDDGLVVYRIEDASEPSAPS